MGLTAADTFHTTARARGLCSRPLPVSCSYYRTDMALTWPAAGSAAPIYDLALDCGQ